MSAHSSAGGTACGSQSRKALRRDCGSEQTVALGCAPVTLAAIWPRRSHGAKGENESVAGVYTGAGEAADVTLGFRPPGLELGRRRWRQKTDGVHAEYLSGGQEKMITWDLRRPSQAAFTPKSSTAAKKWNSSIFNKALKESRLFFFAVCINVIASQLYAAAFAELATICTFGAPSETH